MVAVGAEIDNRDVMLFTLFTDPACPSLFPLSSLFLCSSLLV
jgi:hypothetical protein